MHNLHVFLHIFIYAYDFMYPCHVRTSLNPKGNTKWVFTKHTMLCADPEINFAHSSKYIIAHKMWSYMFTHNPVLRCVFTCSDKKARRNTHVLLPHQR